MIRNDNQYRQALQRRAELKRKLDEKREKYSGIEAAIITAGLELELKQIMEDLKEFSLLRFMELNDAVMGPLQRPILLDQISDLLLKLRLASGLTQTQFAKDLGWKQSNISRFENENYGSHTVSKVVEYASALGIWLKVIPSITDEPEGYMYESERESASSSIEYSKSQASTFLSKPIQFEGATHKGNIERAYQEIDTTI